MQLSRIVQPPLRGARRRRFARRLYVGATGLLWKFVGKGARILRRDSISVDVEATRIIARSFPSIPP